MTVHCQLMKMWYLRLKHYIRTTNACMYHLFNQEKSNSLRFKNSFPRATWPRQRHETYNKSTTKHTTKRNHIITHQGRDWSQVMGSLSPVSQRYARSFQIILQMISVGKLKSLFTKFSSAKADHICVLEKKRGKKIKQKCGLNEDYAFYHQNTYM